MRILNLLTAATLIIGCTSHPVVGDPNTADAPRSPVGRQVLGFYYGWYGNPKISGRWMHWGRVDEAAKRIGASTQYPTLGAYDSHDPAAVQQHCRWAREAGLSGLIASWWAQGDFHDRGMPLLLDQAQQAGLSITIYFESCHGERETGQSNAVRDVLYVLERYGKHPAWLKANGKPVVFVYVRAVEDIGLHGWLEVIAEVNRRYPGGALFIGDQISKRAAQVFDGIHTYNVTDQTAGKSATAIQQWARSFYPRTVKTTGPDRIACVTIIPGYDDSKLGRPNPRPVTDRHGGETYRVLWSEAIAADPDWVLITSWNEWHEGSEIEPSVENGDRELKTTKEYAPKFLVLKPRARQMARGGVSEQELAALRDRLRKISIAVMPEAESDAVWFLKQLGVTPTTVTGAQIVDPQQFNPDKFPITLYAAGEKYAATARDRDDVPRALRRYAEQGGTLLVLPWEALPFFYDTSPAAGRGRSAAVNHAGLIGLPFAGGWERPPPGALKFVVASPHRLPHVPAEFAYPADGDQRWRPLRDALEVFPLITLQNSDGKSLGIACARVTIGKGNIFYAWFRLLDMPVGEALLYDLWSLAAPASR